MANSTWHPVSMVKKEQSAEGLWHVVLDVAGSPVRGTYTTPGQFIAVRSEPTSKAYFALASSPLAPDRFELLVKTGSTVADSLLALPSGAKVEISPAQGAGFPLERARGKDVHLVAGGSGLSAIRSVLQWLPAHRDQFASVSLWLGVRNERSLAFRQEFSSWEKAGVTIFVTVSEDEPHWKGLRGYVQHHFPEMPKENSVAFIVGPPEMVRDVKDTLEKRGVRREHLFENV